MKERKKIMIKKYGFLLLTVLVWIFALLNGTGLGNVYGTNDKFFYILLGVTALLLLHDIKNSIQIQTKFLINGLFLISVFLLSPLLKRGEFFSFEYLYVFMLVYILSKVKIRKQYIKYTSYVYGALGLAILYIYSNTSILKGWNENSIAMIGFFSYAVFCITFFEELNIIRLLLFLLVSAIYISFVEQTDSRTSTIFIIICIIIILKKIKLKNEKNFERVLLFVLNIPLIVAILVVVISDTSLADKLNRWSLETTLKPIFNGRDKIWLQGFKLLYNDFLLGTGKLLSGYWHNSAVACLTAYGSLGYLAWIAFFNNILLKGKQYLMDPYVQGSMIGFLVIFAHQSFELGFIAPNPNLIPYMCLGIFGGRIRCIESGSKYE